MAHNRSINIVPFPGFIGKRHIQEALALIKDKYNDSVSFVVCRVPFFLEPAYITYPPGFEETHYARMIRKFGSRENFERVKLSHGLGARLLS